MTSPFGGNDWDLRVSPWKVISLSPRIEIREIRPRIKPPTQCPFNSYDVVYRPMKYEYEGACKNYDYTRLDCVYCGAALMSNALKKIPFDVRDRCDKIMGW